MDVADILKGFKVIGPDAVEKSLPRKTPAEAFLTAVQDPLMAKSCIAQLFTGGIPVDQIFFDRLDEFRRWIGVSDTADEAIGIVWSEAMKHLSPDDQERLLQIFTSQQGYNFFRNARSVHIVLRNHKFPSSFLADWFTVLAEILEGDVSVDLWKSVTTLCECQAKNAIRVAWELVQRLDQRKLNLSAVILGTLRRLCLSEEDKLEYMRLETYLRTHVDEQLRSIYIWSWATTARVIGINGDEVGALFASADSGTEKDLESVVSVVCCVCLNDAMPKNVLNVCLQWIRGKVKPSLTRTSKYYIAYLVTHLSEMNGRNDESLVEHLGWVVDIQPVSKDDIGTWSQIELGLCTLAKKDFVIFEHLFTRLCSAGASTILGLMQQSRCFEMLLHQLQNTKVGEMVGRLAMSPCTPTRRLGIYLFDKLGVEEISESSFASHGKVGMQLLFHETQRTLTGAETLARILVSIARHVQMADKGFREHLLDEIKLQSRNYAMEFRKELDNRGKDIPEVAEALKFAEDYFRELAGARESGVNTMEVAGHRHAAVLYRRRFSEQVSEGAKKRSVLLGMVKQVSLLYGESCSTFIGGQLRPAVELTSISQSIEIPIVDFFDPEEMALRRIHAAVAIRRLLENTEVEAEEEHE